MKSGRRLIGAALFAMLALVGCGGDRHLLPKQVWDAFPLENNAQRSPANLDEVYRDESHCLIGAEMSSNGDSPGSCYCRDAIADGRYVYFTYLFPAKDRNLNGAWLSSQRLIHQQCGEGYDALGATTHMDWKWSGPDRHVPLK